MEKETYAENELTCPYCNYKHDESYEFFGNTGDECTTHECHNCEKTFHASRDISITYSGKSDCELNGNVHDWEDWERVRISEYLGCFFKGRFCKNCSQCETARCDAYGKLEQKETDE